MTFIAGLPEVDRDEATDDRQEDEMKDPITYRVNDAGVPEGRGAVDL